MSAQYLALDAEAVRQQVMAILALYPELSEDEDLRRDMLDGETDLSRVLSHAYEAALATQIMQTGIDAALDDLKARKDRYARKEDALRELMRGLLETAGIQKMELPVATLSLTKPRTSVNVTDIDALPQGYFKLERKADKTAIKTAIEQGETIPGAELALGTSSLSVRVK